MVTDNPLKYVMGEENYDYWNMTSAMALPHAISYNSIFNSPSSTGSSGGNTASKSSEKTYTLNSSKSNWNFDSEIPKTVVKNSEGNYTLGKNNEWNFDTKYNIPYTEPGNKGQGLVSVPSYSAVTNDYSRNYDVFYRTISKEHYEILKNTGNLKGTRETSTSPNLEFTDNYTGVQIKFYTKQGTIGEMEKIGVRGNAGNFLREKHPDMPIASKGWGLENVQFKQEKDIFDNPQINIQLGKDGGKGLEIFNQNLKKYEVIKENK